MIILQKRIYRSDLRMNPKVFYVFGDNELRTGMRGQAAEMRGEPNAIGFRTKKKPTRELDAYWYDQEFDYHQRGLIDQDIALIRSKIEAGHVIVYPADGVGTGLSSLPTCAPRTYDYIQQQMKILDAI